MKYRLGSSEDYWILYNKLIDLLKIDGKDTIASRLQRAQFYVNGLTDGWFDYKDEFENIFASYRTELTIEEKEIAEFLLTSLKESLARPR